MNIIAYKSFFINNAEAINPGINQIDIRRLIQVKENSAMVILVGLSCFGCAAGWELRNLCRSDIYYVCQMLLLSKK